jgi:hypothetical protein
MKTSWHCIVSVILDGKANFVCKNSCAVLQGRIVGPNKSRRLS